MNCVDNHACILFRIKNTLGIQRKLATALRPLWAWNRGQLVVHRTDSKQEVRNRRLCLLPDTLQLPPTTPPTTPIYNFSLLLRSTEPTIDYRGGSAYQVNYYYYHRYWGRLRLQSRELREVSFWELLILYKNASLPQPLLRYINTNKTEIIVLKP